MFYLWKCGFCGVQQCVVSTQGHVYWLCRNCGNENSSAVPTSDVAGRHPLTAGGAGGMVTGNPTPGTPPVVATSYSLTPPLDVTQQGPGADVLATVTLPGAPDGVSLVVDDGVGDSQNVTIASGLGSVVFSQLSPGSYVFTVSYHGARRTLSSSVPFTVQ